MNIQEYISSGILEAYALGDVTPAEKAEVDQILVQYPEVRAELDAVEATLELMSMKGAIPPPASLKSRITSAIKAHDSLAPELQTKKAGKVVSFGPPPSVLRWKYAAAASIALALLTSYLAYDYRAKWIEKDLAYNELNAQNQRTAEDYNVVNQKLDKIQNDLGIIESTAFRKVAMTGTPNAPGSLASVYWNESTKEAYLSIQNLKALSQEKQYQLWAIVDGKPVDMGVFDNNFAGLFKMKNVSGATMFAVTIEPRGGLASPTLSTMQVAGAIPVIKS